jgi:hypothetical protein
LSNLKLNFLSFTHFPVIVTLEDGSAVGLFDGVEEGILEGEEDGNNVGICEGANEGAWVGLGVGALLQIPQLSIQAAKISP